MKKIILILLTVFIILNGTQANAWHPFQKKKNPKATIPVVWNFQNRKDVPFFGAMEYSVYCTQAMMCYAKVEGLETFDLTTVRGLLRYEPNYFKVTLVMKGKNSTDLPYYKSYYLPIQYGRGADRYWYVFSIMQIPNMNNYVNNIVDVQMKEVNLDREK